jgi:hypothetical protein
MNFVVLFLSTISTEGRKIGEVRERGGESERDEREGESERVKARKRKHKRERKQEI